MADYSVWGYYEGSDLGKEGILGKDKVLRECLGPSDGSGFGDGMRDTSWPAKDIAEAQAILGKLLAVPFITRVHVFRNDDDEDE